MSEGYAHFSSHDWVQKKLASLRQRSELGEEWSVAAARLQAHLASFERTSTSLTPVLEEDIEMLSLVVDEALNGVDVVERYPSFYRKLLANFELRQAFLDALEILEVSQAGELEPLPQPASRDLSFLNKIVASEPRVRRSEPGHWRITWRRASEQLQAIFFAIDLTSGLVHRSALNFLEDESTILLRDNVEVDDRQMDVLLEAMRLADDPESLHLHLFVVSTDPASVGEGPLSIRANLQWGDYQQTAVPDKYGNAQFPTLALDAILDETSQQIKSDLHLSLETM